ncbi:Vam6/Vps39-like protein [Bulinus truncatus]|nr:Vam6/Vps39-like protein [Bulinus truncatus]
MPHDAYEAVPILDKLPLTIESIACYESTLLVGTKQGVLLLYKVIKQRSRGASGETKFDINLDRSNKSFAKKPITQLAAIPELFILISLSDNVISVHDLATFTLICCVQKTKGANLFAVDVQKKETQSGYEYYLRLGVASKRKIQLFYWENREFHELLQDLSLYDFPHALSWCQNSLCVGFKRDYFIINSKNGSLKELFPVGASQPDPIVTPLSENRLALGRDTMSILINAEGDPTQKEPIIWSDIPIAMEHCPPYLIAILSKFVEIRTIDPKLMIQNITLPKVRLICQGSGSIYVASPNNVWCLSPIPNSEQIRQLLTGKEFELALKLAEQADEPQNEKDIRIRNIKNLYAFHLFCQRRFEESLTLFAKLGTDPSHVIGLYPNLLPEEFRRKLEYPDKVPDTSDTELEKGILALIEYLTQKRNELNKRESDKETPTTAIVEGNKTITSKKQLSQIIDTTLLKCYLKTNDALVAPLLRLKDNNCHIEESERVLKKKEKFSELIILYEKKGLHQKALSTLMKQAARPESPLKGHERTVQYLQHLGKDHINLIFEYAEWVLKKFPEDGLKIFTEDLPEIETLPRDQVLDYLERFGTDLAIQYLEYIIFERKDQKEEFHNRLVDAYREKVHSLDEYINSLPESHTAGNMEMEQRSLREEYKKKLIAFLHNSQHYIPERLLTKFPTNGFHEERAILLGRLGRHEQALSIYIDTLKDYERAEDYCAKNYDSNKEGNRDVYYLLLKIILKITDSQMNGPSGKQLECALKLLEDNAMKIDIAKALELLPSTTKLIDILSFLENVLEHQTSKRRSNQVLKSMLYAENIQPAWTIRSVPTSGSSGLVPSM